MSDKEVQRNVRSSTAEGIRTPGQRHTGAAGETHAPPYGDRWQAEKDRKKLLDKFRRREQRAQEENREGGT